MQLSLSILIHKWEMATVFIIKIISLSRPVKHDKQKGSNVNISSWFNQFVSDRKGSGECAKKTQTLDACASDKTTVVRNTAKKALSSVYIAFKHIIIVKNISLNFHSKTSVCRTGLVRRHGVQVSEFSQSSQLQATTNLKFLHLPFQSHSLHWFTFKHFTGMAGGFSFVGKRRW